MKPIQTQYNISYAVLGGVARATPAGNFNGLDYGASVRLTCKNLFSRKNEKTQSMDTIESEIIFKINCDDNLQAGRISTFLQDKILEQKVINFQGGIPDQNNQVIVLNSLSDFEEKTLLDEKDEIPFSDKNSTNKKKVS